MFSMFYGGDSGNEYDLITDVAPVAQEVASEFDTINSTLQAEIAKLSAQNQHQTEMMTEMMERIAKLKEQVNKGAWDKFKKGASRFWKKVARIWSSK